MVFSVFYSLLLFVGIVFSTSYFDKKNGSLIKILLIEYFIISIFSLIILKEDLMQFNNISFFPYILLLTSYFIIFSSFFNNKRKLEVIYIDIKYYKAYDFLIYLYIIFSIISFRIYFPDVINMITENNWELNRRLYYNDLTVTVYDNLFERIALNYTAYFRTFSMLIYFIFLKNDFKTVLRSLLLISIISNVLMSSIENVSRGMIFDFFLLFISMYLFFKPSFKKEIVRKFNILMLILLSVFFLYTITVTVSRFSVSGEFDNNSFNSLVEYFGQSPLVFNDGVFSINNHTYGIYSFGKLFELLGHSIRYPQASIGGSWGSGFYTYVGIVYIDFGVIGVIAHAILLSGLLNYLLVKKNHKISSLFLFFSVYQYLLKGAFVIGRSYIITVIVTIIIYLIIYAHEKFKLRDIKPIIKMN